MSEEQLVNVDPKAIENTETAPKENVDKAAKGDTAPKENEAGDKKFTQDDINAIVEARITRERKKWDASVDDIVSNKLKENQRLSQLSDEERAEEELSQREKALAERESRIEREELLRDTEKVLRDRKIPATFAAYLLGDTNETTLDNIKAFQVEFETAIATEVRAQLSGKTPESKSSTPKQMTKAEILKIKDPKERIKKIKENMQTLVK